MKHVLPRGILALSAFAALGAGPANETPFTPESCIGVIELMADARYPESGKVIADIAARVLREGAPARVLDRGEMADFLRLRQVGLNAEHRPEEVAAIGALTGRDRILDGMVIDYASGDAGVSAVEIELRVIDSTSQAIVWQRVGRGVAKGLFSHGRAPAAALAEEAIRDALAGAPFVPAASAPPCSRPTGAPLVTGPAAPSLVVKAPLSAIEAPVRVEYTGGEKETFDINDVRKLHFNSGSFAVGPGMRELVEEMALILRDNRDLALVVEGHSDSDPGSSPASNFTVSLRRAELIYRTLLQDFAIDPARVYLKALGDTKPVAPNDSPLNKTLNRRVELKFVARSS